MERQSIRRSDALLKSAFFEFFPSFGLVVSKMTSNEGDLVSTCFCGLAKCPSVKQRCPFIEMKSPFPKPVAIQIMC